MHELTIAYRVCPFLSKTCGIFDDKFELFVLALNSFYKAVSKVDYKVTFIMDSCPEKYFATIKTLFPQDKCEFITMIDAGNGGSFNKQVDVLLEQNNNYIYFAEDDYFYFENAFVHMLNIIKRKEVDFVSPYDQTDYHFIPIHEHKHEEIIESGVKWRDVSATTMTFMAKKESLLEVEDCFRDFANLHKDTIMWLRLTKFKVKNPFFILNMLYLAFSSRVINKIQKNKYYSHLSRPGIKHIVELYRQRNSLKRLFFTRRYKLFAPSKTLSTHLAFNFLPRNYDWGNIINLECRKLGLKDIAIDDEYHLFKNMKLNSYSQGNVE
jgi:hypothetical protein